MLAILCFMLLGTSVAVSAASPAAMGPLRVCPDNGRYFCDPAGHAIFLAGSHTWNNLVDMGSEHPPPTFDFDAYLDFLEAHNHNVVRLWTWEVAQPEDWFGTPRRRVAAPLPWPRTGPGLANDNRPRFDLSQHDAEYFQRLRDRTTRARDRGFYLIIMLFEGWSVQMSPGRNTHPFHPDNNINDTAFLADVEDIHTLKHPELLAIQQRYVEEVIKTVAGLDNLLFEIVNEAGGYSTGWQYQMIEFVRSRLTAQGDAAPVGMSYQYRNGDNRTLFESNADWISPGAYPGFYRTNPAPADGDKVMIADTDHISGSSLLDTIWPYKAMFRGLNLLYMDRYHGASSVSEVHLHAAPSIRANLGIARLLAQHLDIAGAIPRPELSSSGYALQADDWLLVLATNSERLEVDLRRHEGVLEVAWFDTLRARVIDRESIEGGDFAWFQAPTQDGALLYLREVQSRAPELQVIAAKAAEISRASHQYADLLTWTRLKITPWLSMARQNYSNLAKSLLAAGLAGMIFGVTVFLATARIRRRRSRTVS